MHSPCGVRHLIYYIYPVTGNGVWQKNVAALKQRAELFNGIRRVIVAEQSAPLLSNRHQPRPDRSANIETDPWENVRDALGSGFNVSPIQHNPMLHEMTAFPTLLREALQHDGVTFYAHGKGVTWPGVNVGTSVHAWACLMYAANLDYWPIVEKAFQRYATVGVLKSRFGGGGTKRIAVRENGTLVYRKVSDPAKWHYAGSFYWFNNQRVRNAVHEPEFVWTGTEMWPGRVFKEHEGYNLIGTAPVIAPYTWAAMKPLMSQFTDWSNKNAEFRRPGATAEPWLEYLTA